MKYIYKITTIILLVVITGCTTQLGRFTAISTNNVRGLEYGGKHRDEITTVTGESCLHTVYITRVAVGVFTFGVGWFMPQFDVRIGNVNDRMSTAVDNATKEGKKSGVFDGDLIVNASVKEKAWMVPLFYGKKCIVVEGDFVSSTTRIKGFLEKKERD